MLIDDPLIARAAAIAGVCLILWLSELVPLYATTLLLMVGSTLALGPLKPNDFHLGGVLGWSAQPVMALFFGGFALSVAGAKYGLDAYVATWMLRLSGGGKTKLLFTIMAGTALLSMWMCNIAAAAMMIATLHSLLEETRQDPRYRVALLVGIAMAANFGGMGTPIGTGPNLIAIGAVAKLQQITFLQWMLFAVPFTLVMLTLTYILLLVRYRVRGRITLRPAVPLPMTVRSWSVVAFFAVAISLWLTESLHGISAAVVGLGVAGLLFATRLLDSTDVRKIEWDTLMLIAGGLTLGELFTRSGLAHAMAGAVDWNAMSPTLLLFAFVFVCAVMAALASNTAAAAMLIQIGLSIVPEPHFAILIALSASMGMPFVISTPQNAMVYNQGGMQPRDLAIPGIILMLVGGVLLATMGTGVLAMLGVN